MDSGVLIMFQLISRLNSPIKTGANHEYKQC
jgi:hypothetical protein